MDAVQLALSSPAVDWGRTWKWRTTMATLNEMDIAESRQIFELCDLNGDGFLDHDEFHVRPGALDGDVSFDECLLDFENADTAGDGYIEFKEFVAWWTN